MKLLKLVSLVLFFTLTATLSLGFQTSTSDTTWLSMEEAQQTAQQDGKPLFVFVEAEWCGICRQMLQNVFPEDEVSGKLTGNYHPVKIDLDSREEIVFNGKTMTERQFARNMRVSATPTTIFIDENGDELGRHLGGLDQADILRLMAYVTSDQFFEVPFEEFELEG